MKYVVAVSGGVDSVVLLDMLVKKGEDELVVAHFDHGIRPESDADARFVGALASSYGLKFETKREELGGSASEELARDRRYAFLRSVAKKHNAKIATAHHQDDVVETIAINLQRGTGWRGLAVLDNTELARPLLNKTKQELYDYACANNLEWVEDETNQTDTYLRNRLRRKAHQHIDQSTRHQLLDLRENQRELKHRIMNEAEHILSNNKSSLRYLLAQVDSDSALEILWILLAFHKASLTRPQRLRLLHAIKTAHPGKVFEAGTGVKVVFDKRDFVVKVL